MELLYGGESVQQQTEGQALADRIANDLVATLNEWHSRPEKWDNALDKQIHAWYANPPQVWPSKPYFSPSAATACPRELYEKGIGSKRDEGKRQPHQGRWTRVGTAIGDVIQRDILFIEKHMEGARFRFLRNERGEPMFEDFAKRNMPISLPDGTTFSLYGTPDGIMEYTSENGEKIRVGLEIKSKQTTPARTSLHSMRNPDEKHVAQTVGYSIMYGVDYYVILYVNAAHKAWSMDASEFEKNPDIRAFGIEITQADRNALVERLADVQRSINKKKPPLPDLEKFTFNNFKEAIAGALTAEEFEQLEGQAELAQKSGLPEWKKRGFTEALKELKKLRKSGPK